uniref:Phosphatase PP2A regulatory subunit A/Splicing factor 3B subunit 1-like HEAT repeat domain-containing protein n=1 Tax=Acrobeloides nanus TaxID=290746 RepID=A0A914DWS0_9BILA
MEPMQVDGEENDSLYPIQVLVDELRQDDVQLRLRAIQRLPTIAKCLGIERARNELIPFLTDVIYEEDDVMIVLCELLGDFTQYIGGPEFIHCLLPPLKRYAANTEEMSVREKAIESLRKLEPLHSHSALEEHYIPMILQWCKDEFSTSKWAACALIDVAYVRASETRKIELRAAFSKLCAEDSPMVRRAVAVKLENFVKVLEPEFIDLALKLFEQLAEDDQDSVRLKVVEASGAIIPLFRDEPELSQVKKIINDLMKDKSWRVRVNAADKIHLIQDAFGSLMSTDEIVSWYTNLLKDAEAEVRDASTKKLIAVCSALPAEGREELIVEKIMPVVKELPSDVSHHVKIALAEVITGMGPLLGEPNTRTHLLPLFLTLLRDDTPEARLNIISSLDKISGLISHEELVNSVLPAVVELCEDAKWRVRLAIVEYMPLFAEELGQEIFDERFLKLCLAWLEDNVFAIREAATNILKRLTKKFGADWCLKFVFPSLQSLSDSPNYLRRLTCLIGVNAMAEVIDKESTIREFVLILIKLAEDPVPNIRFNVAKNFKKIGKFFEPEQRKEMILPILDKLITDQDFDVRFFSEEAKAELSL